MWGPFQVESLDLRGRYWRLLVDLTWIEPDGTKHTVPTRFESNGASIPRIAWSFGAPMGQAGRAGVLHDWLYTCQSVSRIEADQAFRRALQSCGVGAVRRNLMYRAVRAFGAPYYNHNAVT